LLANSFSTANQASDQIQALQNQENPSLIDRLQSLGGLATILGTAGLAASGNAGGAAAFGLGGVSGLQGAGAEEQEAKANAIESLQKQRDDALDRGDKAMNRISNLVISNADLFVDPETGEPTISEELLGFLATGEQLRLSPSSRRKLNRADELTETRLELLQTSLEKETTVAGARETLKTMFGMLEWSDPPEALVDTMAKSLGTPEMNKAVLDMYRDHGGISGIEAFIRSKELGLSLTDPKILRMVDWKEEESDKLKPAEVEKLEVLKMDKELNDYAKDPANKEAIRKIRQNSGNDEIAYINELVNTVFAGRAGDIALYLDERRVLADNDEFRLWQKVWAESGIPLEFARAMEGFKEEFDDMNPEQQIRYQASLASKMHQASKDELRETTMREDAVSFTSATNQLSREANLAPDVAQKIAKQLINDATDESGRIDKEELQRLTRIAIQQFNEGK